MDSLISTVCESVLLCCNHAADRSAQQRLLTTMKVSDLSSSFPRYYWLPSLLDMLSGHPALHPAFYIRLWELLHAQVRDIDTCNTSIRDVMHYTHTHTHKETQLSESHLLGLAVLCSEMFGNMSIFSPLRVEGAQTLKVSYQ